jgi:branched-chain amino acid transport system ATP-binding protein
MPLLEARGVHKRFGAQIVLDDVSLSVEEGELVGIIGPNGAGKTTLFNVLTGRYRPERGRINFAGRDITGQTPAVIARTGIARSFQLMNLFDDNRAIDNVIVAMAPIVRHGFRMFGSVSRSVSLQQRAAQLLSDVGLAGKEYVIARSLAYGDRRCLEIAVALAAEPRLLFLDEPTAGMGAQGAARLTELILDLRKRTTIVVIEHDMPFLFGLADRINVIHWGQVIARGTPDELREDPWVARSNLGQLAPASPPSAPATTPVH